MEVLVNVIGVPGHTLVSLVAVKLTIGFEYTRMTVVDTLVVVPSDAVRVTVYVPTEVYAVEADEPPKGGVPLPRSQV